MTVRAMAGVLIVALLSAHVSNAACVGWQRTAELRAACCKAADHSCAGEAADSCCAQSEQRENAFAKSSAALAIVPPAPIVLTLLTQALPRAALADHRLTGSAPHVPTHVLFSVFLV